MDQHQLKSLCLGLPGASEEFPFGEARLTEAGEQR